MTIDLVVELLTEVFYTVMIVLLPVLGISLVVGILLSIFQAATSIQEMTLTFVPKIVITALTIILLLPFIADKVITMSIKIFTMFETVVK
ncbi:MAG: flagellar biosynthetic protein FliQ [Chlorobi bacterium]|nr:flagellar biosynthetic protein FliQ [Chlorobiota bacterium]